MNQKTYRKAKARYHELVVLHALGKASLAEESKLDRYQVLLRYRPCADEIRRQSRFEFQGDLMLKFAKAISIQRTPPQRVVHLLNSRFWELV